MFEFILRYINAIICKEADIRLNVFVYVVDVQQEEYRSQKWALWDTRCNICAVRQGSINRDSLLMIW